ncbi:hypothetical protein PICMEDRAFT_16039 [Pichia membranifaciens NRRL Y-2026]|uniref:ER membrane protein complex subunit 10 n=1 Tax=Pichia membranifaciens NRRL Y-2026 TaxID=763406 RepID=A0A1E3NRB9_9ASCO|nr:hypothetical protein PICMEDRAFT_16039 [Pichia membranifaciens NRRL Y-2026]ODQ48228.1 hypothetical protein PICMEDRAFT_16039 [Pichia membranifaciens NRRL Y-2026]
MIQLFCIFAIVLLHLINGANCTQSYDLLIHPVGVSSANGYPLSNLSINSSTIDSQLLLNKALATKDLTESPNGWCLSLRSQPSDELTASGLECFNYFKPVQSLSTHNIAGELGLVLDVEHKIVSVNFYPKEKGGLSLHISKSYEISDPQPRLRLDGKTDATDDVDIPKKSTKKQKNLEPKGKILEENKEDETSLETDELKDFQEIVKPRGLYSDEKTFIEKYWVYIVPPMLVIFVVGNLGGA